jgi:hypothetical protein
VIPYAAVAIMRSGSERALIPLTRRDKWVEERCRIIVNKLNEANSSGSLRFLTWGKNSHGHPELCGVSYLGSICQIFIYSIDGREGNSVISELGRLNEDAIRFRDGRAYLNVSMALDPNGTECGDGFELKDDLCQKKPDPPCPDGTARGNDGHCLCPDGKVKDQSGACIPIRTIDCGPGTILSPDGKGCVAPTPSPFICPVGWGATPSGCMPLICPAGMSPSTNGCIQSTTPAINCPKGMPPFLCSLLTPRNLMSR